MRRVFCALAILHFAGPITSGLLGLGGIELYSLLCLCLVFFFCLFAVVQASGIMFEVFLSVNKCSIFWGGISVLLFGCCCPLQILGKWDGCGVQGPWQRVLLKLIKLQKDMERNQEERLWDKNKGTHVSKLETEYTRSTGLLAEHSCNSLQQDKKYSRETGMRRLWQPQFVSRGRLLHEQNRGEKRDPKSRLLQDQRPLGVHGIKYL